MAGVPPKHPALIDYKLRIHGFPVRWRTLITAWEPPFRFVDEQVRGSHEQWIHTHAFEPYDGGTIARGHVRYATPFDWLVHRCLVRSDIQSFFKFCAEALRRRFAAEKSNSA